MSDISYKIGVGLIDEVDEQINEYDNINFNNTENNYTSFSTDDELTISYIKPPVNLNLFDNVLDKIEELNDDVRTNVFYIIDLVKQVLLKNDQILTKKLSNIYLSVDDDKTGLLEWNYEKFKIGFTVEKEFNKSSYYIVENDFDSGYFYSESKLIKKKESQSIIKYIVNYIVRNT